MANCTNDNGCGDLNLEDYTGNPYGIFIDQNELNACKEKSRSDKCILYVGMKPEVGETPAHHRDWTINFFKEYNFSSIVISYYNKKRNFLCQKL